MRIVFGILSSAGLNFNGHKCSFGLKDITYLCYVITREGINPETKKVQGIMDLGPPSTTTEARVFIFMIHYCRDMWTRRSHILYPLTEAASGPKGIKILWNDALESSYKELNHMVSAEIFLSDPFLETDIHSPH